MLEFLNAAATAATPGAPDAGLPDNALRFCVFTKAASDAKEVHAQIANLIGAKTFGVRRPPSLNDDRVFLLEFPGVQREQSSAYLFAVAQELREASKGFFLAVEPDVDAGLVSGDELMRDMPESVGGLVRIFCESKAKKPENIGWALDMIGAPSAWSHTKGKGILIGQPDTGVADHHELEGAVLLNLGVDILEGGGPPIDPLSERSGNPGHGTATASCVAGAVAGQIAGAAPAASVVPIRCINAVVIGTGVSVAAAVDHAIGSGCGVITMSLGGPIAGIALRRAIKRAVDSDVIVLAAAGNCVGLVVYPAWDENVIAVAAVDERRRRWTGSSKGDKIDFAAPGENVYVARRTSVNDADQSLIAPGQGTSFAVALAAGCAALWLAHHGVGTVKAQAKKSGVKVNELFRAAARQTALRPSDWPQGMGAGVINAARLLDLPLENIQIGAPTEAAHPGAALVEKNFDWEGLGAELGYVAFDRALREDPVRNASTESGVAATPSAHLLKGLPSNAGKRFTGPALLSPLSAELSPSEVLRRIAAAERGAMDRGSLESARRSLRADAGSSIKFRLQERLEGLPPSRDRSADITADRKKILGATDRMLEKLAAGSPVTSLSYTERNAYEAIVKLVGRPALRTKMDDSAGAIVTHRLFTDSNGALGEFTGVIAANIKAINNLVSSVGRIDCLIDNEWIHIGTGTLIDGGLVLTNRHVLDVFAEPWPGKKDAFKLTHDARITFCDDPTSTAATRVCTIKGVVAAGPQRIGRFVDFRKLDMAFLEVETAHALQPAKFGPFDDTSPPKLLVVGFPAPPPASAGVDPDTGETSSEIWRRLMDIFQEEYSVRYASPGIVERKLGAMSGDTRRWAFGHDATTLAGHSGSPVIAIEPNGAHVCGLHFAGEVKRQNCAHSLTAVNARRAEMSAALQEALKQLGLA